MNTWPDGNAVVAAKTINEWLKSDEELVDYSKCEFKKNVSNNEDYIIFDLGEYEHDPDVRQTIYRNGVDLARVVGCICFDEPYKGMRYMTAIEGDDYLHTFLRAFRNVSIDDFVLYFCHLLDGDIYISEENHHVFVKGRRGTEEDWKEAADELNSRSTLG